MLAAAALCPGPPLLVPALSGVDPAAAQLRAACDTAVATLLTGPFDEVGVVGGSATTGAWPPEARPDFARYGAPGDGSGSFDGDAELPLSVGIGAWLLDRAGHHGDRLLWSVAEPNVSAAVDALSGPRRLALLVIADGSAKRTLKAPGYLDERAADYDGAVEQAVSTGDIAALRRLDAALARELMAPGWAALQVLAALAAGRRPHATVHYADAPFGVGYLVASLAFSAATDR
jgi:hypothetical protein